MMDLNTNDKNQQSDLPTVFQRTFKQAISTEGVGLHSGAPVNVTLIPAEIDHGVVFRRTDVEFSDTSKSCEVPALWHKIADTRLCSTIANEDGVSVGTVEHLMAALAGCGIDNALIELDGPEVPVMDGSSAPFVELIRTAGVVDQEAHRRIIRVLKPVSVATEQGAAELLPSPVFSVDFEIEFASKAINRQHLRLGVVNGAFCKELANARTFGFLHEVEAMRQAGLARGGSLENAIVIDGDEIMNEDGLRHDDEFVRHKALDAVGDLYLAGRQIIGAYRGERAGHAVNNALLHALFEDPDAWCFDILAGDEMGTAVDGGIFPTAS